MGHSFCILTLYTLLHYRYHRQCCNDQSLLLIIRNELYPGLNRDYSILELADSIKTLNNNGTFQYMLDANSRRHWGGIFEAPTSYRLVVVKVFLNCTYFVLRDHTSPLIKRLCEDAKGKYIAYKLKYCKLVVRKRKLQIAKKMLVDIFYKISYILINSCNFSALNFFPFWQVSFNLKSVSCGLLIHASQVMQKRGL